MEVIELIVDENNPKQGVYAVSTVLNPAMEEDFIALNKHYVELKEVDEEKRLLMGAALIPDKKILRIDEKTKQEYYIFFTKETVKRLAESHSIISKLAR